MSNFNETRIVQQNGERTEEHGALSTANPAPKKAFVEPEITYAVDVLEATTFFQQADSGIAP